MPADQLAAPDAEDDFDEIQTSGVDGLTGELLMPALPVDAVVEIAKGNRIDPDVLADLEAKQAAQEVEALGLMEGIDPLDLADSGWGVIFPSALRGQALADMKAALEPLLTLRAAQAGDRFRVFEEDEGYADGVAARIFVRYFGSDLSHPVNPEEIPYYLMLVGMPEDIPFRFQYELDSAHAVGRLGFATLEEYAAYATSVFEAEKADASPPPRSIHLWGPEHDKATRLSKNDLLEPLTERLLAADLDGVAAYAVGSSLGATADKGRLGQVLGGAETPAILVTASHGVGFDPQKPGYTEDLQRRAQGALVCQERGEAPMGPDVYFSGQDVAANASLAGRIAVFFACYSVGTPQHDAFAKEAIGGNEPKQIAPGPIMSALPTTLLGRPDGMLAVVGHVDRAWGYSFHSGRAGSQTGTFESALLRLMKGFPVGNAMEYFDTRYGSLSIQLAELLKAERLGDDYSPQELAATFTAQIDAQNYAVLGDPAVRIRA